MSDERSRKNGDFKNDLSEGCTHQFDTQEDRLVALHREIGDLSKRRADEQKKIEDMVQHISLTQR